MDKSSADAVRGLASDLRTVLGQLKRRLRDQALPDGLTWPLLTLLVRLEREGPTTVTALARAEAMRPQSMGERVAALQDAGLVQGASDPADGRQTLWSLSAAGRERIKAERARRDDWLARVLQENLSAQERKELARSVALLRRLVET